MSLGRRIKQAREGAGLSQDDIARVFGISRNAVAQWESDETRPTPDKLPSLAKKLGKNVDWLLSERAPRDAAEPHYAQDAPFESKSGGLVPLVSWSSVIIRCRSSAMASSADVEDWLPCPVHYSRELYALRVAGNAMAPEYSDGEFIFVDPTLEAGHNDDVVICTPDRHAAFRRLQLTPEGPYLLRLNQAYPDHIVSLLEGTRICGVVVFSGRKRR